MACRRLENRRRDGWRAVLPGEAHRPARPRDRHRRSALERSEVRQAVVLLLALVLAGCGGGGRAHGTATLWVTHDRGGHVVPSAAVPAGLDGIQTVERKLKVTTRYGGRYVQSIDGVEGSLGAQRDWFFFVNGKEG